MILRLTLSLVLFLLLPSTLAAECSLRVRASDYAPQYYKDSEGNWHGMAIELASLLLSTAGCKAEFEDIPWARSLLMIETGELDMLLNVSKVPAREKDMYFIGPQRDETMILIVKKGSKHTINSLDDITNLPNGIGIERGNFYGDKFSEKLKADKNFASKVSDVTSSVQNYQKLKLGRVDGFVTDRYNYSYRIGTNDTYQDFAVHPFVIHRNDVYFAFSKKSVSQEIINRLKQAYYRLASEGEFEKIMLKYR